MKRILSIIAIAMLTVVGAYAQESQYKAVNHEVGTNLRYKLYQTFNMWTFLKLDTRTGSVSILQFSTNGIGQGEVFIGAPEETYTGNALVNGRYELYPTANYWTFIMIDQINGNTYHVQWSQEKGNSFVLKI